MTISEAALAGMKANGRGWRPRSMGIREHAKVIGRANDGEDVSPAEVEKAALAIAAAFRAYPTKEEAERQDYEDVADELEMIADGDLDDITEELNRAYDLLDFWRVLA
jgi:hypothetical protein